MLSVGLAFAGLLVLGVCAIRVHAQVRALGRQIRRTRARLTASQGAVEKQLRPRE
jgi:uncharacterized membrane protein YciS (DUF1049 family)